MLGFNCIFENNEVYGSYKNGVITGMMKEIVEEVSHVIVQNMSSMVLPGLGKYTVSV